MEAMQDLKKALAAAQATADEKTLEKFRLYMEGVLRWNEKVNLTAITDRNEFVVKHFIDSLICLDYPELKDAKKFNEKFGTHSVYMNFVNPNFKVTVGDFRTRSEALALLETVKKDFPSAFIVKENVMLTY